MLASLAERAHFGSFLVSQKSPEKGLRHTGGRTPSPASPSNPHLDSPALATGWGRGSRVSTRGGLASQGPACSPRPLTSPWTQTPPSGGPSSAEIQLDCLARFCRRSWKHRKDINRLTDNCHQHGCSQNPQDHPRLPSVWLSFLWAVDTAHHTYLLPTPGVQVPTERPTDE